MRKLFKLYFLIPLFIVLAGCVAVAAGTAATTSVAVMQDRRTPGTIIEDKTIHIKTMQAIKDVIKDAGNTHVEATSYNMRVLLIGQVPSRHLAHDIEEKVKAIKHVKQVHNEIEVKAPTSLKTRSNDSWITTKIKSEMTIDKRVNTARVKVITEDGVVYLMGIITLQEEEPIVEIARRTTGVKKVVKVFDYEKY